MECSGKISCECPECESVISEQFVINVKDVKSELKSENIHLPLEKLQFIRDQIIDKVDKILDEYDWVSATLELYEDNFNESDQIQQEKKIDPYEYRICEECGSKDTEHLEWDDEDDPNKIDICRKCNKCDHITTLRTEEV